MYSESGKKACSVDQLSVASSLPICELADEGAQLRNRNQFGHALTIRLTCLLHWCHIEIILQAIAVAQIMKWNELAGINGVVDAVDMVDSI